MKLGLQIPNFTWPGGTPELGRRLGAIVCAAEDAGYDSVWVMDHFFQIPGVGPFEAEMLEAYTTLGYIAGRTQRIALGTLVTGVTYRHPGILIKQVTTLDVLSGGRAWLGIGAAWAEREHRGLGVPFPPLKERFERLEETLRIARQMWSSNNGAYAGKHYHLAETLNSPQALSQPQPRILIGGGGERKTLRLVARYANASNVFGDPETVVQKLAVLRRHCAAEGRDYDSVEKTVYFPINLSSGAGAAEQTVERLRAFATLGVQTAIGALVGVEDLRTIETVGREIIPQIADL